MANTAGKLTRQRLIVAAERLFAERGIDAVPLSEIAQAAQQRNVAATNYYFGDRDGVVRAIFDYRLPPIVARQREMLDEVQSTPQITGRERLRRLLEAFTVPMAE